MSAHPSNQPRYADREDQARHEIGVTDVRRPVAVALTIFFLAVLTAGLLSVLRDATLRSALAAPFCGLSSAFRELLREPHETTLQRLLAPNRLLLARLRQFEETLDEGSPPATALRVPVQVALAALGAGDEQVLIGRNGWLYYVPDVTALTGPGIPFVRTRAAHSDAFSPAVTAITDFQAALAPHGIRLFVLPVSAKPGMHPEGLTPDARPARAAMRVRGFKRWADALRERGVTVFDAVPALSATRQCIGQAYLRGDTHWTPEAMDAVAAGLAASLSPLLPESAAPPPCGGEPVAVCCPGDTARMLALPPDHRLLRGQQVTVRPVVGARADDAAVVLLGDSFANIYSLEAMGWGSDAGLAERLALHLGQPVRPFVRNDSGAWGSRERFIQALARGELSLKHVRVVVWEFAERELAHGDWRTLPLPDAPAVVREATAVADASAHLYHGRIASVSDGPRRGAPYADFVVKWHVTELQAQTGDTNDAPSEAVVLLFGMRQRTVLPSAALRPGARVTLELQPWSAVEPRYGTMNAGTLDDPMLEIELPLFWADRTEADNAPSRDGDL